MLAVAHALGIRDAPDGLPLDRLAEALADDPSLLVLDNFGHLLDASPTWARCSHGQQDEDATRPRR
jgi:predicted ATPase